MDKQYEVLAKLYLRLKGFVVTNLIIHSNVPGSEKSEIDIVAVRMPYHSQEYRHVNVPDYLECSSSRIEIIIGDVKNYNNPAKLKFNRGLRRDRESIKQLVYWLGVYEEVSNEIIEKFEKCLNLHRDWPHNEFAQFSEDLNIGRFTFKFTFFCPSLSKWNGRGFKYIDGQEMIDFIWECLSPLNAIETCSRMYNLEHWNELDPYVRFFKEAKSKVTPEDFERYVNEKGLPT